MDGLLSEVRTTKTAPKKAVITEVKPKDEQPRLSIKSLEDVLDVLRNEPDFRSFRAVITHLEDSDDLSKVIKQPSAKTTQILAVLVNDVLPNYWIQLNEDEGLLLANVVALTKSVPALGALVNRLRVLSSETKAGPTVTKSSFLEARVRCAIELLERLLDGDGFLSQIWVDIMDSDATEMQKTLLFREISSLIASGKVITSVSQAEDVIKSTTKHEIQSWLGDGKTYTTWLATNLAHTALKLHKRKLPLEKDYIQLFAKALSIGYLGNERDCFTDCRR
jgi:telomere length regulation protein